MAAGQHLEFDETENCAIRPADTETLYSIPKHEVDLMTR